MRRFVFYHEREKTTNKYDDLARERLLQSIRSWLEPADDLTIERIRELFLSLSALEKNRSWYAKSLLPVHENLLMWEALRKGATIRDVTDVDRGVANDVLDKDINFTARNFFARGGELYYLLLSAGTERHETRRRNIECELQRLLQDHHSPIGELAKRINENWSDTSTTGINGTLHYIPDGDCDLYEAIAEDIEALLAARLDVVEQLHLLAHLICFHIVIYIYVRAHPNASEATLNGPGCMDRLRPTLLIDALESAGSGVLRRVSATLFKVQEDSIQQRARSFIEQTIRQWADEPSSISDIVELLDSRVFREGGISFSFGSKKSLEDSAKAFQRIGERFRRGEINQEQLVRDTARLVHNETQDDFRRHFLPVHKKLAKDIGFVTPKTGRNARYTLGDNLLKALTLANARDAMTYDAFLDRLHQRYGLVVGEYHARTSGLYDRQPINVEYYNKNQAALLTKLIRAGLAYEYSDATAMVAPFRR